MFSPLPRGTWIPANAGMTDETAGMTGGRLPLSTWWRGGRGVRCGPTLLPVEKPGLVSRRIGSRGLREVRRIQLGYSPRARRGRRRRQRVEGLTDRAEVRATAGDS